MQVFWPNNSAAWNLRPDCLPTLENTVKMTLMLAEAQMGDLRGMLYYQSMAYLEVKYGMQIMGISYSLGYL